jgi:putative transposase
VIGVIQGLGSAACRPVPAGNAVTCIGCAMLLPMSPKPSRAQQSMVAAALRQAFLQPDRVQASAMLRQIGGQLRPHSQSLPRSSMTANPRCCLIAIFASRTAAIAHHQPLERVNKEVKRRADVVRHHPH